MTTLERKIKNSRNKLPRECGKEIQRNSETKWGIERRKYYEKTDNQNETGIKMDIENEKKNEHLTVKRNKHNNIDRTRYNKKNIRKYESRVYPVTQIQKYRNTKSIIRKQRKRFCWSK